MAKVSRGKGRDMQVSEVVGLVLQKEESEGLPWLPSG